MLAMVNLRLYLWEIFVFLTFFGFSLSVKVKLGMFPCPCLYITKLFEVLASCYTIFLEHQLWEISNFVSCPQVLCNCQNKFCQKPSDWLTSTYRFLIISSAIYKYFNPALLINFQEVGGSHGISFIRTQETVILKYYSKHLHLSKIFGWHCY